MGIELPKINNEKPTTTEAIPAFNYDSLWLEHLAIHNDSPGTKATARIKLRTYDKEAGVVGEERQTLKINDLLAEAERVPLLGEAMGKVLTIVTLMNKEQHLLDQIKDLNNVDEEAGETVDQPAIDALQVKVTAVQKLMGIKE